MQVFNFIASFVEEIYILDLLSTFSVMTSKTMFFATKYIKNLITYLNSAIFM